MKKYFLIPLVLFAVLAVFLAVGLNHDPHEVPREHGRPQAIPGLDLCARFAGVRRPPRGGLHKSLGRANQVAFFAWGTATLRGWWSRINWASRPSSSTNGPTRRPRRDCGSARFSPNGSRPTS